MADKLTVYWFGHGGSSWMAERLRHTIEDKLDMKLVTIHEHPDADIPWSLDTVYRELEKSDIIIVPSNYTRQPCKSNNRLTQAMAIGKPVVCDCMPSYIPIVKNLHNAIMLKNSSLDEWEFALSLLKEDKDLRGKLGTNALKTAKEYSIDRMADKWIINLNNILSNKKFHKTNVDVIIPTKKNIPIIKECLESFKNSSLTEEVYIIDNDCESDDLEKLVKELGIPYEIKEI